MIGRKTNLPYKSGDHALTLEEVQRLLSATCSIHDKAIIALAAATGIRREDIVQIRKVGYSEATGTITYWEQKKQNYNVIYIPSTSAIDYLNQHIATCHNSEWLFPSPTKTGKFVAGHISGRHLYDIFNEALELAGLERRPFHCLRATCFQLTQKRGWNYLQGAKLLNDSLNIVQMHYDAPSVEEMKDEARDKPLF